MRTVFDINKKIIRQINLWIWLACILPLTAMVGLWFAWAFGSHSTLNILMIAGGTSMFFIAVAWWWWAIRVMRHLLYHWNKANDGIQDISRTIKEIRIIVNELFLEPDDK